MRRGIEVIYSQNHIRVRHDICEGADTLIISFANLDPSQRLDAPGFGEQWIRESEFSGIYFNCSGNDWYQYAEMPAAVAAIEGVLRNYRTIICYGASMGAYAAIAWSGRLGAHRTLAFAPQFSISPTRAPFEKRWLAEASKIPFIDDDICRDARGEILVAYDPASLDGVHFREIAAQLRVHPIPLRHCGHTVPLALSQMNLLSPLLRAVVDGSFDAKEFLARFKRARATSASYLLNLSRIGRSLPRKLQILRKSLEIDPNDSDAQIWLGDLQMSEGDPSAALQAYRRSLASRSRDAWLHSRLGQAHAALGDFQHALSFAEEAARLAPHFSWFWFHLGNAAASVNNGARAAEAFETAVKLEPQNDIFRRRLDECRSSSRS